MKKIFALVAATLMVFAMATPVLGADKTSKSIVNEVDPVIGPNTFSMKVLSTDGTSLWGDGAGVRDGLADPYIIDGETISVSVDVSDANGESDLQDTGTIAMGFFKPSAESDDWGEADYVVRLGFDSDTSGDGNIDTLTFLRKTIINEGLSGEYEIHIGASDEVYENPASGAWFSWYPDSQLMVKTVYFNPLPGLEITAGNDASFNNIDFGANDPGKLNVPALQNTIHVKNTAQYGGIQDILIRADDLTDGSDLNIMGDGNGIIYAESMYLTDKGINDNAGSNFALSSMGDITMSTSEKTGADDLINQYTWMFDLDLDYPTILPDGAYTGTFVIIADLQ